MMGAHSAGWRDPGTTQSGPSAPGWPGGVSWSAAAALPVPGLTALQALSGSLQLAAGDTMLVNGGGGVTGGLLVQLATLRGAWVIAPASLADAPRLRRAGADLVLDYRQPDWPDQARKAAGGALPAGVNAVPGGAAQVLGLVADGGRLTTLTSDPPDPPAGCGSSLCTCSRTPASSGI
jgi:NADPH:quinone reductase-like Zn-dependent oxidoreductase